MLYRNRKKLLRSDSPAGAVKTRATLWKPNILHNTVPSIVSKLSSHIVPHSELYITSTLPELEEPIKRAPNGTNTGQTQIRSLQMILDTMKWSHTHTKLIRSIITRISSVFPFRTLESLVSLLPSWTHRT